MNNMVNNMGEQILTVTIPLDEYRGMVSTIASMQTRLNIYQKMYQEDKFMPINEAETLLNLNLQKEEETDKEVQE